MAKIYTKTGDKGSTHTIGGRTSKCSWRVKLLGGIDELNAQLGVVRNSVCNDCTLYNIEEVQHTLMDLSSLIAKRDPQICDENHIIRFEELIDSMTGELPPLKNFILPGGMAGHIHLSRAICRRVEILCWDWFNVLENEHINEVESYGKFFNRLSDLLFTTARYVNYKLGCDDIKH